MSDMVKYRAVSFKKDRITALSDIVRKIVIGCVTCSGRNQERNLVASTASHVTYYNLPYDIVYALQFLYCRDFGLYDFPKCSQIYF